MGNVVMQHETELNSLDNFLGSFVDERGRLLDGHTQLHVFGYSVQAIYILL
jgi:hypothetical protein